VNAAARRYKVVLDNGLWMNIVARQKKILRLEIINLLKPFWQEDTTCASQKLIIYFLRMKVTHAINGIDPVPHAMYKSQDNVLEGMRLYEVAQLSDLVSSHQDQLPQEEKETDTLELKNKKQPHLYVKYHRYLWLRVREIRTQMSAIDPEAKLPSLFTVIPQFKPKARCIDLGTDQMVELLLTLSEQEDTNLPWPKSTQKKWKQRVQSGEVWPALFKRIPRNFTGTLTTDGVQAMWHIGQTKADKKQMMIRNRAVKAKATKKRKREKNASISIKKRRKQVKSTDTTLPMAVCADPKKRCRSIMVFTVKTS
jgi:hypothetical protein